MIGRGQIFSAVALGLCLNTWGAETVMLDGSPARDCFRATQHYRSNEMGIEHCDLALEHQVLSVSDLAATHSNRGILLSRIGEVRDAMKDHNKAVRLAPEVPSVYVNRANTKIRQKEFLGAMDDLDQAIALSEAIALAQQTPGPVLPVAYYNRALLLNRLGDKAGARADAERAVELNPEGPGYAQFIESLNTPSP